MKRFPEEGRGAGWGCGLLCLVRKSLPERGGTGRRQAAQKGSVLKTPFDPTMPDAGPAPGLLVASAYKPPWAYTGLAWVSFSFFKDFIYLFTRDAEGEAGTQAEGEAGSLRGTQCRT